jgi:hypothetical protein
MDTENNAADVPDLTPQNNFQNWTELYDAIEKRLEQIRGMRSVFDTQQNRTDLGPEGVIYVDAKEYKMPPKAVDPAVEKEKERQAQEAYRVAQTHALRLLRKNSKLFISLPSEKTDPFIGLQSIQELCIEAKKTEEGLKQVEADPANLEPEEPDSPKDKIGFLSELTPEEPSES